MNAPAIDDDQLQQLFDGELPPAQADAMRQLVEADPALQRRFQELVRLRRVFAAQTAQALDGVDFEAMYARIQRDIAADTAPSDDDAAAPAQPAATASARLRGWRRIWRALLTSRAPVWMPAAGTLAVAAAVLLMVYAPEDTESLAAPRAATAGQIAANSDGAWSGHSEVVAIDFGDRAGTVFEIDLADGLSAPVVWIHEN